MLDRSSSQRLSLTQFPTKYDVQLMKYITSIICYQMDVINLLKYREKCTTRIKDKGLKSKVAKYHFKSFERMCYVMAGGGQ